MQYQITSHIYVDGYKDKMNSERNTIFTNNKPRSENDKKHTVM